MRIFNFTCRGETFQVNPKGHIRRSGTKWCTNWCFLGISKHHWSRRYDVRYDTEMPNEDAKKLVGGIVWDCDHGSVRTWGGRYLGKLPRITSAYFTEE